MTDGDALLAAVHAAPDDDAPRLVFADWLDEHGQPERAAFLRIQVAQRREFESHGRTVQLDELFVRARGLCYQPWAEPVRSTFGRAIAGYSRGFPTGRMCPISPSELTDLLSQVGSWLGPQTAVVGKCGEGNLADLASRPEL